jgi:SAM-dependent methyltransferase
MPLSEQTAAMRRLWDGAAALYDGAITPALADAHGHVVAALGPVRDADLLDLGCGTGRVAELAAARGARVTAVDLSAEMAARARARPALAGARVEVMDAQALALPDGAFDAVVAAFSLMFCPRPDLALSEARRVLRPGGRLVAAVWGLPEECETVGVGRAAAAFATEPPPALPLAQSMGDPDLLRGLLLAAGFAGAELRPIVVRLRYPGPDACWAVVRHIHGHAIPADRLGEAEAAARAEMARVGLPLRNRAWLIEAVAGTG